jgi:hypothetical protein
MAMIGIFSTYCSQCRTVREINDWREQTPDILLLELPPCGHTDQRCARLEWQVQRAVA